MHIRAAKLICSKARTARQFGIFLLFLVGIPWLAYAAAPYAHTQPATHITTTSAVLNGMVVRNGENTTVWFEWGQHDDYDQVTETVVLSNGFAVLRVSASITNLTQRGVYQYRLVASNGSGVVRGAAVIFSTGSRIVAWGRNDYAQTSIPPGLSNVVGVASGFHHTLALKSDGTVVGWGYDPFGSTVAPSGLSDVIGIAAGAGCSLAVRSGGTVVAWGAGVGTNVPVGLDSVIAVAAGSGHSLALRENGTVAAWGRNDHRQATVPWSLTDVVAIAAGGEHSLALKADGKVVAWGLNYNGQTNVPSYLNLAVAVAGGGYHSLALRKSGDLVPWGRYDDGQLSAPASVAGRMTAIAGGGYHSMALLTNGTVVVWGQSIYNVTNVPARLSNVVSVVAGEHHCVALGNAQPQAISRVLSGAANTDTVITLGGTDTFGEVLNFRITSLPLAGTLFQAVNGERGDPILSPGVGINDPEGRLIFAPEPNGDGNPYAVFTYVASDGMEDSAPATVTINIGVLRPITHPATAVRPTAALLNGMVLPNGFATTAWFEWGVRGVFDQNTSAVEVGDAAQVVRVSASIGSLTNGGVYQCRLVASNLTRVVHGPTQVFTTGKKVVAWGFQTNVPAGLSNVVTVSSCNTRNVALTANGDFTSWSGSPFPDAPSGLTNIVAAVASSSSILTLTREGDVVRWNGSTADSLGLTNAVAVAAGFSHYLALKSDGTVLGWSSSANGLTNVPPGLSNVVGIAAGTSHSLALMADGAVLAWGDNTTGQTNVPADLRNVVAIAAGGSKSLALTAEGRIVVWGATHPEGLSNIVAIAGGGAHSLALNLDGEVIAWGYHYSYGVTNVPAGLSNVVSIAAGSQHSLAVGDNLSPQVVAQTASGPANTDLLIKLQAFDANADPLTFRITTLPTNGTLYQFSGGTREVAITETNTIVTDTQGKIFFAPLPNDYGENYADFDFVATDGETDSATASVAIQILGQPYASTQSATEIRTNSAVLNGMVLPNGFETTAWFEWGNRGSYEYSTTPVSVGMSGRVVRVSESIGNLTPRSNYQFRVVLSNSVRVAYGAPQFFATGRNLVVWGNNSYGQTNAPSGLTNVVAVAGGGEHSLALRTDGKVVAWGANYSGQTNVPSALSNVVGVAANASYSLALKADGKLAGWGTLINVSPPANVSNVVSVATSAQNALALRVDGSLLAWGYYAYDLHVVPPGLSNIVAIASGSLHNLALKADGKVFAWGANNAGQTNVPPDLTNIVAIACGKSHSLALRNDGKVFAWGLNSSGQTFVPTTLNGVVAIAGGGDHSMAIRSNGAFVAWGDTDLGVTTAPSALTNVAALASGYSLNNGHSHNLVIGSRPPTAFARSLSGYPNHDCLVTLFASDPSSDPLTFRIASLPARGFLYQYSPHGRGAPVMASNTVVTDNLRRLIFAPETNEFGSPYATFLFLANDGDADSAQATMTVNVILPPAPHLNVYKPTLPATGVFDLNFSGQSNASYRVWASTNLLDWEVLGTATVTSNGWFNFLDSAASNWPWRFYRAGAP